MRKVKVDVPGVSERAVYLQLRDIALSLNTLADEVAALGGGPGGAPAWGDITGTLSAQTDLKSALSAKSTVHSGTTTVDFGTGATDVTATVTGQTGILVGSLLQAWIYPVATASNTLDDHWVDEVEVTAGSIVANTGFTIYAKARDGLCHGVLTVAWEWV